MVKIPTASLGAVVALLGSGLALLTLLRPPTSRETHALAAESTQSESLDVTLTAPMWLRSGAAEDIGLELTRGGLDPIRAAWLAAPELHAGGAVVLPAARQAGPLRPGDQVVYRWSLAAPSTGIIPVEISVRLRWSETGGEEIVWADAMKVEVRDYLGMDAATARTAGILGSLVGVLTAIIGRRLKAR